MPDQWAQYAVNSSSAAAPPPSGGSDPWAVYADKPAEPSWSEKAGKYLKDTFDKTTKAMNVTNVLDTIENIGDRLRDGDWSAIPDAIKVLPNFDLGNDPNGGAHKAVQQVQDTYSKIKAGDYSGATANVLPYVLVHGDTIAGKAGDLASKAANSEAVDIAKTAGTGAVQGAVAMAKNPKVYAPAAAAAFVPAVGPKLAAAIEGGGALYGAVKGASNAVKARAADIAKTQAVEDQIAEVAARQANTPKSSPSSAPFDANQYNAPATPSPAHPNAANTGNAGPVVPLPKAQPLPTPAPAYRTQPDVIPAGKPASRFEPGQYDAPKPSVPQPTPSLSASKSNLPEGHPLRDASISPLIQKPPEPVTPAQAPSPTANIDPAVLDAVAQFGGFKSFDKVPLNSPMRQSIIDQAAKFKPRVDPMQKFEQAADVLTNPQNGPMANRIQTAMAHVDEGVKAAQPEPQPQPAKVETPTPQTSPQESTPVSTATTKPEIIYMEGPSGAKIGISVVKNPTQNYLDFDKSHLTTGSDLHNLQPEKITAAYGSPEWKVELAKQGYTPEDIVHATHMWPSRAGDSLIPGMTYTAPAYRGQGIASSVYDRIAAENPDMPIQRGALREDGKAFRDAYDAKQSDAPQEYYKPTGRGSTDVPTPGDLIKQGYLEQDMLTGGSDKKSAAQGIVASENEKAYNFADYLFSKLGVRTLDDYANKVKIDPRTGEVDSGFMKDVWKHGKSVDNPTPKNPYSTPIGRSEDTGNLAVAHLLKMITEEKMGLREKGPAMSAIQDEDLVPLLLKSIDELKAKKAAAGQ